LTFGDATALGLLQGIAEFLPISSSGHLTLAGEWLEISEPPVATNLALHMATLLVIVLAFRKKIWSLLFPLDVAYLKAIIITSIPTAILGLAIKKGAGDWFIDGRFSAMFLVFNGFGLIALTLILRRREAPKAEGDVHPADNLSGSGTPISGTPISGSSIPSWKKALVIGVVQGIAALPGISRSGSTIGASRLMGIPAAQAAEYSLLASIPVIFGAALLECRDLDQFGDLSPLLWGSLVAVLSGWFAVGLLLKIVNKNAWMTWGFYCIGMGTLYGVFRYG
jgi:undecaprenyl-diphosphatase